MESDPSITHSVADVDKGPELVNLFFPSEFNTAWFTCSFLGKQFLSDTKITWPTKILFAGARFTIPISQVNKTSPRHSLSMYHSVLSVPEFLTIFVQPLFTTEHRTHILFLTARWVSYTGIIDIRILVLPMLINRASMESCLSVKYPENRVNSAVTTKTTISAFNRRQQRIWQSVIKNPNNFPFMTNERKEDTNRSEHYQSPITFLEPRTL